jgi:hypothetical protein
VSSASPDHPLVHQLRVRDICEYLNDRGWRTKPFRPEALLFEGPPDDEGRPIVQLVPSSEQMPGFNLRSRELLHALSVIEGRPAEQILLDIVSRSTLEKGESTWYRFDSTVLPIVLYEIEACQPRAREDWDKELLSGLLKKARDVYDGVAWPWNPEQKSLILTAAYTAIALANLFESSKLLQGISLRILRMWQSRCRGFSGEELHTLRSRAESGALDGLYELMFDKVSGPAEQRETTPDSGEEQVASRSRLRKPD